VKGKWTLQIKSLAKVDLTDGVAPEYEPRELEPVLWRRAVHKVLETI
jgi:hypothetical protein